MARNVLSALNIVLGADTAQVARDMGKARAIIASETAQAAASAQRAMDTVQTAVQSIGPQLKGVSTAVGGAQQAFALMGASVPPAIGGITNSLAGLTTAGLGPVAAAVAALTAVTFAAREGYNLMRRDAEALTGALKDQAAAVSALQRIRGRELEAAAKARQARTGKSAAMLEVEDEIARTRRELEMATSIRDVQRRRDAEPGLGNFITRQLNGEAELLNSAEGRVVQLELRLEELEKSRTATMQRESEERTATEAKETAKRIAEAEKWRDAAIAATRRVVDQVDRARALALAGPDLGDQAVAGINFDEQAALRDLGTSGDAKADAAAQEAVRRRFRVLRIAASEEARMRAEGATRAVEAETRAVLAARADLDRDELDARLAAIERDREAEIAGAATTGADVAAIDAKFRAQADLARAEAALRTESEARAVAERLGLVQRDLAFANAQTQRDTTEREIAEVQRRYAALIEEAKAHGIATVEIEKEIAERIRQIRAENAPTPAPAATPAPSGFGEGFSARAREIASQHSAASLGEAFADRTILGGADDLADALWNIADGAESAGQAFRKMAQSMVEDLAKLAAREAAIRVFALLLGGGSDGGAAAAASASAAGGTPSTVGAAHGGTWRVGGFGGLDSQFAALKVSPGELIRVSDGANSRRGDGDVHVALSVRPPAVIADDVLAKSSREAKAAVVSKAVRRPGQRGWRPRD